MTDADRRKARLMLNAAIDGELDAAGILEVERCVAADPAFAIEYRQLISLRNAIRRHAPLERAPAALRRRVEAALEAAAPARRISPAWRVGGAWRSMAAAAVVLFIAGSAFLVYAPHHESEFDATMQAVAAGYMRAQVSGTPVDVASSDRHTVKPWLGAKVPLATAAVDLSSEGFPLAGGRIDIVANKAVPTLVYKHRLHFISVSELIVPNAPKQVVPRRATVAGYSMVMWQDNERAYYAVSDVSWPEMEAFVAAFRRGIAAEQ